MARARASRILLISLVVLGGIAGVVLGSGVPGGWLVHADEPARADIVVVLAGDYRGHRLIKAAELVRRGFAPRALVSGPYGFYGRYECDFAIPFAESKGYPRQWFVPAPNYATSTTAEADALLPLLRRMGVRRYLLVTSDYHTARAARIFRARAPDLEMRVIAAPDEYFRPGRWWANRESQKVFVLEWMKTVAYWMDL